MRREITKTKKDMNGNIIALCNENQFWSPIFKIEAIKEIESGLHTYFVSLPDVGDVDIHVVEKDNKKYLRTDPDKTTTNNLDNLPNC